MTTRTTIRSTASALIALKGAGKAAREAAYLNIAPLSYSENMSRAATINNLRVALGKSPTDNEQSVARVEWIIGRVACRLVATDLPRKDMDGADKLEFARDLVTRYAAPPQDGKATRKLRAGQIGRRSISQHRTVRAAEEAWSQIKAELGIGTAQTQKERNEQKRSTNNNPVRGKGKKGKALAPTHAELVKPVAPKTAADAVNYVTTQAASMLAYANKNAKLLPVDFGSAVTAFKSAIDAAGAAYKLACDKADADKADKMK